MTTPTIKDIRAAAAARRSRRVRNRRLVFGAGVALVVLSLLSWWVVPVVVKGQIESRGTAALARTVSVEEVAFNPFNLAVTVRGLQVEDPAGGTWVSWQRLRVNPRVWSLVRGRLGFDAIELDGFVGRVAIGADGALNFADLVEAVTAEAGDGAGEAEAAEPMQIEIGALAVAEARIEFSDASLERPFASTLGPVSFTLTDFHTVGDPEAPYQLVAETEAGERFSWRGDLSATPLRSEGEVELAGLQLAKYGPYLAAMTPVTLQSGELQLSAKYTVRVVEAGLDLRLEDGAIHLIELAAALPDQSEPSLQMADLTVSGLKLDWLANALQVGEISWQGGAVRAVNRAEGIDLLQALVPPAAAAGEETTSELPALQVQIDRLKVAGVAASWRDEALKQPTELGLADLTAQVDGLNLSDLTKPVRLGLQAALANDGGHVAATGELALAPLRPALAVSVENLAVAAGSPYAQELTGIGLPAGRLDLKGSVGTAGDSLVFRGDVGLVGMRVATMSDETLAQWESLRSEGINFVLEPLTLEVDQVRWVRPDLSLSIRQDGSLNWATDPSFATEPEVAIAAQLPADGTEPVIRVHQVELVEAQINFRDGSLVMPAGSHLTDLSGTLSGLSSVEIGKGKAELHGKANGSGAVAITGDFNPLGRPAFTDVQIKFQRVDLSPLNGYVGHYAGYALKGGRMSLDVDFKLKDNAIDSETVVTLDDFNLGAKVASPDATKLPVGLALKLLRDTNGQIVIDVPVQGSLEDPEFRFGRVVWRVITNVLSKAATAPFAMLGSLVGGGAAEDLDEQVFAAASAELSPTAIQKLDTLAKALAARPGLNLVITGEYDPAADRRAWQPMVLENRLRESAAAGQWSPEAGWAAGARSNRLVNLYLDVFGDPPIDAAATMAAVEAAQGAEPPLAGDEPEPDRASFLAVLRRWFGGGAKAEPTEGEAGGESATATVAPTVQLLPEAEIERRLVAAVEITDAQLAELAMARAAAVRDYLGGHFIGRERLTVESAAPGGSRVKLELQ